MERFFRSFKTEWMQEYVYKLYLKAESDALQHILQHNNTFRGRSYNNGFVARFRGLIHSARFFGEQA